MRPLLKVGLGVTAATMGITLMFAFVTAIIVFGPFLVVWALNTLVPVLAVPYSGWSWLAVVVLYLAFGARWG